MTSEEISNSNVLMAHFMGLKCGNDWEVRSEIAQWCHPMDLKYDKSWDWLMPVVEKIETMDYGFKMCRKVVEVYVDSTKEVILKTKESCRMESLFKAVVEFINWYNANKK